MLSGVSETVVLNMSTLVWSVVTTVEGRVPLASEVWRHTLRIIFHILIETVEEYTYTHLFTCLKQNLFDFFDN